jgi:hypothetical protein
MNGREELTDQEGLDYKIITGMSGLKGLSAIEKLIVKNSDARFLSEF